MTLPLPADKYALEKLPAGWANADVTFQHKNGVLSTRVEILDLRNGPVGTRYQHEPQAMIAGKCFLLFLAGVALYTVAYAVFHLVRLPFVAVCHPTKIFSQIWAIVRIPFYFIALEFAALEWIFSPIRGRAHFGCIESSLHDGKTRREAIQYERKDVEIFATLWRALREREHKEALFIGFCMQPIGKTDDPHVQRVDILPEPALAPVPQHA
jgi:hypothetical protein